MAKLRRTLGVNDVDGVYQRLIEAHYGLSDEESAALNARLILLLLNHLADDEAALEAIALARDAGDAGKKP